MNNHQKVTICLKNGKFQPCGTLKIENLNPKALLLCSAAECAGFTVMNLLSKSNIMPKNLEITAEGTLNTPTLQAESIFTDFKISYNVECKSLADQNSVSSAIKMAQEKHCGMITMLRKIAPVSHDIAIVSTETVKV
ncbi:MAG: OsmC family protein [Alistipes sp.]|jgi:putative redox protein|nr:OsmC family protein [Alistipes sp.]MBQ5913858.1 OsmC family protein [Alistipes sp.]